MALNTCECCQKPETAWECLGPRTLACDSCGRSSREDEAFYESKAYRILNGDLEECGADSAVLSCERCEVIHMRAVRWLGWISFLFPGEKS